MTPLRKKMLDELCRHNYAPRTQQNYVGQIARLARHYGTSPDQLTREQVQQYQDMLTDQRASWLPQCVAAMQFFYNKTLDRNWTITHSYRSKQPKQDPVVLTLEEVAQLLDAVTPLKAKMLFTTMYGCGLRVSEAIGLQVTDIDSQRMVIHIRQSKGRKDRYVPLGTTLLEKLRVYWRAERPTSFLFPGSQVDQRWSIAKVREEFRIALRIAGTRWLAYTLTEVEKGFRRISGYRDLPQLMSALERTEGPIPSDAQRGPLPSPTARPKAPAAPHIESTTPQE